MEVGRGGLIRSRKGCETCRARHVKCDEGKPSCQRCRKDGRKCDGYKTTQNRPLNRTPEPEKRAALSALPTLPDFEGSRQRDLFAFYVSCISDASSLYFGVGFWGRCVLQLSLSEAAIRYALCSLSALQRSTTISDPATQHCSRLELRTCALQQYNHAVRHTRRLLSESSDGSTDKLVKGLVACALFVCYESFTGNHELSHMHLENGLRIIAREYRRQRHTAIPKEIVQVFRRLDLQVKSIGNAKVSHPNDGCAEPIELVSTVPPSFTSFEDSLDVIHQLVAWILQKPAHTAPCPISPADSAAANKFLADWYRGIEDISRDLDSAPANLQRSVALLKMHQIIMTVIVDVVLHRRETLHNAYLDRYEQIVALADALICDVQRSGSGNFFCFDIGVILPLFWVGTKCRESGVRRRAIALLASMSHQEGIWKSGTAARVAQVIVDVEEEGLPPGVHQEDVPETARVHWVATIEDDEKGVCYATCLLRSDVDEVSWYTRERSFPIVESPRSLES
ncbi:C6 zinc finger domain protein [Phlyctema vagabunda]|uniref:C6 zinc finger domain protein n=1 Tax=Phlyctema vagabunda TaxID=108571 RepID=A0ABR4PLP0_9HELO